MQRLQWISEKSNVQINYRHGFIGKWIIITNMQTCTHLYFHFILCSWIIGGALLICYSIEYFILSQTLVCMASFHAEVRYVRSKVADIKQVTVKLWHNTFHFQGYILITVRVVNKCKNKCHHHSYLCIQKLEIKKNQQKHSWFIWKHVFEKKK